MNTQLSDRAAAILFVIAVAVIGLIGGSSRFDAFSQPFVRVAAVGVIATLIIAGRPIAALMRPAVFTAVGTIMFAALQLVPLPPVLWSLVPGREIYLAGDRIAGLSGAWRPLSISPDLTFNALFALFPALAVVLAFGALGPQHRRIAVFALAGVVAASALLGVAQLAGGASSPLRYYAMSGDGAVGLLANRNHAALLLAIGFPCAATVVALLMRRSAARLAIAAFFSVAVVLVSVLVLNGSRAGIGLGIVALFVSSAILWKHAKPRVTPRLVAAISAAAATLVGLSAFVAMFRPTVFDRFVAGEAGDGLRAQILPVLGDMALHFAPFGSGMGTFVTVYRQFERTSDLSFNYVNAAHNDFAQIVIEAGAFGLLAILLFAFWWLRTSWAIWRDPDDRTEVRIGRLGSATVLLILLASVVDYPLRTPLVSAIFAIACCLMLAARDRISSRAAPRPGA